MKFPAVTDFSSLPMILTINEIAAIYRISLATIRRGLQNGTFSPRPWDRYPYRWRRDDVVADVKRARVERPRRAHGFATTRRRPAKASLEPTKTRSAS